MRRAVSVLRHCCKSKHAPTCNSRGVLATTRSRSTQRLVRSSSTFQLMQQTCGCRLELLENALTGVFVRLFDNCCQKISPKVDSHKCLLCLHTTGCSQRATVHRMRVPGYSRACPFAVERQSAVAR